jgi:hypothetical protein
MEPVSAKATNAFKSGKFMLNIYTADYDMRPTRSRGEVSLPFHYGRDPNDSSLRIAATFPCTEEVRQTAEALATCALLAATEKLLQERGVS